MVINFSNIVPKTWPFPGLFPHMVNSEAYTYSGNKVTSIKDTCSAAYSSDFRFSNGTNTSYAFTYNASGRMTSDASKGITSISWNVLGLPQTVTFSSGAVINYSYAADGTKLREAKTVSSTTTLTDYTGNRILENGTRSRLLFDGGYVSVSNSAYHFFITDHLGSVRVVANTSGTAEEYNHYYPLGGPIAQYSSSTSLQPIKYQGKEWGADKGLQLYDFGARRYDPSTGKWISQDPLSEKYYAHSPYLFCAANPMRFVDPEGKSTRVRRLDDGTYEVIGGNLNDFDLGIYVGMFDDKGKWQQLEESPIGYTATLFSFYNTDRGADHGWRKGSIIDPNDKMGISFLREIESGVSLVDYLDKGRSGHQWDVKNTNNTERVIPGINHYRGMPIGSKSGFPIYASARDVGNIAAGIVAGAYAMSWNTARIGFDMYQSYTSKRPSIEGFSTQAAQRYGWEIGHKQWLGVYGRMSLESYYAF